MLKYKKLKKKPAKFRRYFGVDVTAFEKILPELEKVWDKNVTSNYKRPGRDCKLSLAEMLMVVLLYYRSYITQEFTGFLFDLDASNICRIIRKLEPLLASIIAIDKGRDKLSKKEVEELIVDATESRIERPKRNQKRYYSGKKKAHTVKTEIRIKRNGEIIHVSKTVPGSVHDFTLFKEGEKVPIGTRTYADSGYQGLDKLTNDCEIPYKKSKTHKLDKEEKEYNRALSRIRVKVENVLAQIKTFRILSCRYRNKRKRYNLKFQIIAGLVNVNSGFATI